MKFQNLKLFVIIRANQKKINVKTNLNLQKKLKQKPSKFQYFVVRKLTNLIYYLNAWYFIHILSVGFRTLVNQICRHGLHNSVMATCYNLVKVLSTEFLWQGSICKSNILMFKSQTWWWIFTLQHAWAF